VSTMAVKQLELWPGHIEFTRRMAQEGHSTHVELHASGLMRLRVKLGHPDAKEGQVTEHSAATPEGAYKIPST
jgi:hypothetical protein